MLHLAIINAVLACALLAFLCIIWLLGNRIRAIGSAAAKRQSELERRVEEMGAALRDMASELESQRAISAARLPAASLNLNKRSQALAMLRRNETAEVVAAALELPPAEVQLLMKVEQTLASAAGVEHAAQDSKPLAIAR
jgi:hypothetical protein